MRYELIHLLNDESYEITFLDCGCVEYVEGTRIIVVAYLKHLYPTSQLSLLAF